MKQFKVLTVSKNANSFGLFGHLLVAKDGEAWEVGRSRGPWNKEWNRGDVIDVPTDKNRPQWHLLSCEIPEKKPSAPPKVAKQIWETPVSEW